MNTQNSCPISESFSVKAVYNVLRIKRSLSGQIVHEQKIVVKRSEAFMIEFTVYILYYEQLHLYKGICYTIPFIYPTNPEKITRLEQKTNTAATLCLEGRCSVQLSYGLASCPLILAACVVWPQAFEANSEASLQVNLLPLEIRSS